MKRRGFLSSLALGAGAVLSPKWLRAAVSTKTPIAAPTMIAGPVGTGIPIPYPLTLGGGLDRAYLVPFADQLYDAEVVEMLTETLECDGSRLTFFKNAICDKMQYVEVQKDNSDTNLNQRFMLDYPREFQVTGVGVFLGYGTSEADKEQIINNGCLQVIVHGSRLYSQIPLMMLPMFCDEEAIKKMESEATPLYIGAQQVETVSRVRAGFHPLHVLGDSNPAIPPNHFPYCRNPGQAFRIKVGDPFNVRLKWPKGIKLSKRVKIMVALDGYCWVPL